MEEEVEVLEAELDEVILAEEEVEVLEAEVLELPHADQVAGSEDEDEVLTAGTLDVVLEELHAAHVSAEATPAIAATVATENFILIESEVTGNYVFRKVWVSLLMLLLKSEYVPRQRVGDCPKE